MLSLKHRELTQQWAGTDEEFQSLVTQLRAFLSVAHNDDGTLLSAALPPPNPVATVVLQAGPFVPYGWLVCNGAAVSRTTYRVLFNVIGTTYGTGDGVTTFNVPSIPPLAGLDYLILAV